MNLFPLHMMEKSNFIPIVSYILEIDFVYPNFKYLYNYLEAFLTL